MRRLLLLALAVATPTAALASVPPPPGDPRTPIQLVDYAPPPAQVTCGERSALLVEGAPAPSRTWQAWVPPVRMAGQQAYVPPKPPENETYTFSIDAHGQVKDLKRAPGAISWGADDQMAVIAGWRFAPGAAAAGCQVALAITYTPIAQASPARLFQLLADRPSGNVQPIRRALGGDCVTAPRRRPKLVAYPDLRPFDDRNADPAWAGLLYDIDADGAVRNVRVAAQRGETAFADAAASAVAEARFFPGAPRTGCLATFKAQPRATDAPARPSGESFERAGDDCKVTREALNIPETKLFPPAYAKRRVGGWAILRFDVAPWGQVGGVEVLASQPSNTFGDVAQMLLSSARPNPPASGYRGCVVPIVYAIPPAPEEDD